MESNHLVRVSLYHRVQSLCLKFLAEEVKESDVRGQQEETKKEGKTEPANANMEKQINSTGST